jgi:DNA repair protein RecO (recombination protein O)
MPTERAVGIVVRTADWSESSRIATFFTREFGKVRALAKGGRRLKSNFEVALDLLTVCSIVLIRKSSGGLDLLTEARAEERFAGLKRSLPALYGGYYIAELLGDGTQDNDPHRELYDRSLACLRLLADGSNVWSTVSSYEMAWLGELGLRPELEQCVGCSRPAGELSQLYFSPIAGGILCPPCAVSQKDRRPVSTAAWNVLRKLAAGEVPAPDVVGEEIRQLLGFTVSSVLGRRPRLLGYLGS